MWKLSEVLLSAKRAERHPFEVILVGFIYTSISLFLSLWLMPDQASIVMVFLTVIACLYVVQSALIIEENKEKDIKEEIWILKEHGRLLRFFFMLFVGFVAAFTFWTLVLPESVVNVVFSLQQETFEEILSITGRVIKADNFSIIMGNNLRVLALSLILALFYGAGAIFILVWNASMMGYIIGSLVRFELGFSSLPHAFLKYSLHGIPEILAYFMAALAGSILFISLIRGDLKKGRAKRTLVDFLTVIFLAIVLLIFAALIETYISPLI